MDGIAAARPLRGFSPISYFSFLSRVRSPVCPVKRVVSYRDSLIVFMSFQRFFEHLVAFSVTMTAIGALLCVHTFQPPPTPPPRSFTCFFL